MTDYLNFTYDQHRDITNNPGDYHDFRGSAFRIQCYWTSDIWRDYTSFMRSADNILQAEQVLKKYTLSLDAQPFKSAAEFGAAQKGKAPNGAKNMLKYSGSFFIAAEGGGPSSSDFKSVRDEIGPSPQENRLIVLFAPISGPPSGYTVLNADLLPWIIVDPRIRQGSDPSDPFTAMHEMAHACRLGHLLRWWQPDATMTPDPTYLPNLMNESGGLGNLWGWQVDEIFDSYWCNGARPDNWSNKSSTRYYLWDKPH